METTEVIHIVYITYKLQMSYRIRTSNGGIKEYTHIGPRDLAGEMGSSVIYQVVLVSKVGGRNN